MLLKFAFGSYEIQTFRWANKIKGIITKITVILRYKIYDENECFICQIPVDFKLPVFFNRTLFKISI